MLRRGEEGARAARGTPGRVGVHERRSRRSASNDMSSIMSTSVVVSVSPSRVGSASRRRWRRLRVSRGVPLAPRASAKDAPEDKDGAPAKFTNADAFKALDAIGGKASSGPFGGAGLCAILARIDAALALSTACEEGFDSSSRRPSDDEASRRPCDALLALSMAAWEGWALCFVGTTNPTPESSESDSEESESLDSDSTGAARFFVGGGFFGGAGFLDLLWLLEGTTNALAVVSSSAGKSSPRSSERRRAPI